MANKTATLKVTLSYVDPSGQVAQLPSTIVQAPYQAQTHGTIDVADATAADTALAVPFGSVAEATCALVVNRTGQELRVKVNGNDDADESIPTGGMRVFGSPTAPGEAPLTAIEVETSAIQSGDGLVEYHLFGDPT